MQVCQVRWSKSSEWETLPSFASSADLVFVFSDDEFFHKEACFNELREKFPKAHIVGCSSAGSIAGVHIYEGNLVVTIIKFDHSSARVASLDVDANTSAYKIGEQLASELAAPELRHIFVLADGLQINGSELALGLNQSGFPVTGGLAGDGTRFKKTWVMANAPAKSGRVVAVGFYGNLTIKSGCFSGWEEFGAERVVTKSSANVVYEIDGQPALALYKKYLGEFASELPASGLRFPLSIQANKNEKSLIRTLLAVDEAANSLTFAGDVPQGHLCKLMRTNLDLLIENAGMAADAAKFDTPVDSGLSLVVSCVGRRLVMGQLIEEELDEVHEKSGKSSTIAGFYSYGEMAPFQDISLCQLHNQTMTLTTICE
jgi:hypothetical protein